MMPDKSPKEIREEMWKAMAASPYVMLGTTTDREHFEPMYAVLDEDADSEFWFYTKKDNRAAAGGPATVQFVSKNHDLYASLRGTLTTENDPAVIDRYWNKQVEAWYEQGRQDPSLLMLRFNLADAEIWETDHSITGKLKMLTGNTIYDEEAGSHTRVTL
jgi:general stress protein 26